MPLPRYVRSTVVLAVLLLLSTCGPEERIERYPLRVLVLEFADSLRAGAPDSILVGAGVGYEGCELESAAILLRNDSLLVTGMARCRVQIHEELLNSPPRIETPPVRDNLQRLMLPLPALETGRYVLVADALQDTVVASSTAPPLPRSRIAAAGWFTTFMGCRRFVTNFEHYEFVGPATNGLDDVRVYGIVRGTSQCDSTLLELHVRRFEPSR